MRRSANQSGLTPTLTILALSAILLLCIREAHAEDGGPEVRVYHAREKAEQSANDLKIRARGGETVDLKAELFAPESDESPELQPRNSRVNEFRWAITHCGVRAKNQGCKEQELVPEGEALRYKVPGTMHDADVEIVVSHGTESAKDAVVTITVSNERATPGEPGVTNADNKKKGEKDRPGAPGSLPKDKEKEKTRSTSPSPESPGKRNGGGPKSEKFGPSMRSKGDGDSSGGGDSSSGSSSSSSSASRKSKSKKSGNDDWSSGRDSFGGGYDDFSYGFGGGGGGGAKTNARGFNRGENTASVVSCTHTAQGRIVCEDPAKKVLRVRAPRRSEQAPKLAKQIPAKTQTAPVKAAPAKTHNAPAKAAPAAPRPAKAAPAAQKRLPSEASLQKTR